MRRKKKKLDNNLTIIVHPTRIVSSGQTEVGSAQVQPARNNQPGWRNTVRVGFSVHPLPSKCILDSLMPKKS